MASTYESGHTKIVSNAKLLLQQIEALGVNYNPSNDKLISSNLIDIYEKAIVLQENLTVLLPLYTLAVDERQQLFAPINKKTTKLKLAYKTTEGVTAAQLEDFMTIARKLKGYSKRKKQDATLIEDFKTNYSTSQMSFDYRTQNYGLLISLLENTPNYNPNEEEFKIAFLKNEKEMLLKATHKVTENQIPLTNARGLRNHHFYTAEDNLVDTFNLAKDYIATILDSNTLTYNAIVKIKFKKFYKAKR